MDREEFKEILNKKEYPFYEENGFIVVSYGGPSGVFLPRLESLPPKVKFKNPGYVDLSYLVDLPEGIEFYNTGEVFLHLVEKIPGGTIFLNGGDLVLEDLKKIEGEVSFENGDSIWMESINLEGFHKGVRFNNKNGKIAPASKFNRLKIMGISYSRTLNSLIEQIYG